MLSRVFAAGHLSPVPLPSWKHCTQHGRPSALAAFLEDPLQNHRENQHLLSTVCVVGLVLDAKGTASDTEMPRTDYGQDHGGEETKIRRGQGARSRTPSSWLKETGFKPKPTGIMFACHCLVASVPPRRASVTVPLHFFSLSISFGISLSLSNSLSLSLIHTRFSSTWKYPLLKWNTWQVHMDFLFPAPRLLSQAAAAVPEATAPAMPKGCFSSTLVNMFLITCKFVHLFIWWAPTTGGGGPDTVLTPPRLWLSSSVLSPRLPRPWTQGSTELRCRGGRRKVSLRWDLEVNGWGHKQNICFHYPKTNLVPIKGVQVKRLGMEIDSQKHSHTWS